MNFTVRYHFNHTVLLRDFEKGFTNYKLINHTLEGFENNTVNILHIQLPIAKDTPSQVLYFAVRPFVTDVEVEANISNIASVWYPAYFSGRNIVYERIVISMVFLSVIGAITFVASVALVDKYRKSDHFHLDTNSCKYTEEVYLEGSQGSLRKSVLKKQSSSLTSY